MKRLLLVATLVLGFSLFAFSQEIEVPQSQTPMVVKIAASWCPPCGGWGWNFFDDIYEDNAEDAIFLSVHHSGDHTNTTASDLTTNFNVFGQPKFIIDGNDQNVSSSNASSKRTEIQNLVIQENNMMPVIQSGIDASYTGDNIQINYSVELFENLNGEYNLALYLVEKVHIGYQASQGDNAEHKELLRAELHGNSFGNQLFSGEQQNGSIFNGSIDYALGSYDPENLSIVGVIWEKEGNEYLVVNSNKDDEVEEKLASNNDEIIAERPSFILYPTKVTDNFNLKILSKVDQGNTRILISDLLGRKVKSIYDGPWMNGGIDLRVDKPEGFRKGMYFVSLETQKQKISKKIFFE